jgi:hypothetical protein
MSRIPNGIFFNGGAIERGHGCGGYAAGDWRRFSPPPPGGRCTYCRVNRHPRHQCPKPTNNRTNFRREQNQPVNGASLSILTAGESHADIFPTAQAAKEVVSGYLYEILGTQNVEFTLRKNKFCYEFVVAPLDVEESGILGVDILRYMEAKVDLWTSELVVGRTRYPLQRLEAKTGEKSSRQPHFTCVKSRTGQRRWVLWKYMIL